MEMKKFVLGLLIFACGLDLLGGALCLIAYFTKHKPILLILGITDLILIPPLVFMIILILKTDE